MIFAKGEHRVSPEDTQAPLLLSCKPQGGKNENSVLFDRDILKY